MIFFPFFCLAYVALQNVNKSYVIFLYFRNFIAKSDQKQKSKNGMNVMLLHWVFFLQKLHEFSKESDSKKHKYLYDLEPT